MITLRRIDHVGLRVAELEDATERWALQFGLTIRDATAGRSRLACDDEPYAIELLASEPVGLDHVAYELAAGYNLSQARAHLETFGADVEEEDGALRTADADGNSIVLLPCREPASRLVAHARPAGSAPVGHPRRLGHVNFLTGICTSSCGSTPTASVCGSPTGSERRACGCTSAPTIT